MSKPVVAIVGRPNVGKSTLFNVLAGEMISIVKDTPGVTRDRIYADVDWLDREFTLIDTGGIEPDSRDIILSQMREQAQIAIDTADVIIFITDVKQGLVDSDSKVAAASRRPAGRPGSRCPSPAGAIRRAAQTTGAGISPRYSTLRRNTPQVSTSNTRNAAPTCRHYRAPHSDKPRATAATASTWAGIP